MFFPLEARYLAVELPSTPAPTTHASNTAILDISHPKQKKRQTDPDGRENNNKTETKVNKRKEKWNISVNNISYIYQ